MFSRSQQPNAFGTVGAMETHFHAAHVALSARRERLLIATGAQQATPEQLSGSAATPRKNAETSEAQKRLSTASTNSQGAAPGAAAPPIPLYVVATLASTHVDQQCLALSLGPSFDLPSRPLCLKDIAERFGVYDDAVISFWGVWFVVAAAARFKRPITRKREFQANVEFRRRQKASAAVAEATARQQQLLFEEVQEAQAAASILAIELATGGGGPHSPDRSPATSRRSSVFSGVSSAQPLLRRTPSAQRLMNVDSNAFTVDKEGRVSPPVPAALLAYDFSRDPKKAAAQTLRDAVAVSAHSVKEKKCTSMAAYKRQVIPRDIRTQKVSAALRRTEPLRLRSIIMPPLVLASPRSQDGVTTKPESPSPSRPMTSPTAAHYTPRPPTGGFVSRPGTVPHQSNNMLIPRPPPAAGLAVAVSRQLLEQEQEKKKHHQTILGEMLFEKSKVHLPSEVVIDATPVIAVASGPVFLLDPDLEGRPDPLSMDGGGSRAKRRSTVAASLLAQANKNSNDDGGNINKKSFGGIEMVISGVYDNEDLGPFEESRRSTHISSSFASNSARGPTKPTFLGSPTANRRQLSIRSDRGPSGKEEPVKVSPNVFSPSHYHGGYGDSTVHSHGASLVAPSRGGNKSTPHASHLLTAPGGEQQGGSRAPSFSMWARAPSVSQFAASGGGAGSGAFPPRRASESRDMNTRSASSSYAAPQQAYLLTKRRRVQGSTMGSRAGISDKSPSMVLHEDEMDVVLFPLPFQDENSPTNKKGKSNAAIPLIGVEVKPAESPSPQQEGNFVSYASEAERNLNIVRYPMNPSTGSRAEVSSEWMRSARRVADKALHERLSAKMARTNATHAIMRPARKEFLLQQLRRSTFEQHRRAKPLEAILHDTDKYISLCRRQEDLQTVCDSRRLWFTNFYEEIVDRFAFTEALEHSLWAVQLIVQQAGGELSVGLQEIKLLFEALTEDELSEVGVQFVLCHLCAAFSVPYNTFRELLELRFLPYLLLGNGMFVYKQPEKA